jgi:hypothetical protein
MGCFPSKAAAGDAPSPVDLFVTAARLKALRVKALPPGYDLQRAGAPAGDDGWVVARASDATAETSAYDVAIAGGAAWGIGLETSLAQAHPGVAVTIYDGTPLAALPPGLPANVKLVKQALGDGSSGTTSASAALANAKNAFVKLDLEGGEYALVPALCASGDMAKIRQLVLEVHGAEDVRRHSDYYKTKSGVTPVQATLGAQFAMLEQVLKTHALVHVHANNACAMHTVAGLPLPSVFECTFLRKADFPGFKWPNSTRALPDPVLDCANVAGKPQAPLAAPFLA